MPAAAVSDASGGRGVAQLLIGHLDFVLLALALPVFLAARLPLAGYGVAAAVWIGQAALVSWMESRADASRNPRAVAGLLVGGSIARAWIAAIAILVAGVSFGDAAGLACAVLLLAIFTVYFVRKMIAHYLPAASR